MLRAALGSAVENQEDHYAPPVKEAENCAVEIDTDVAGLGEHDLEALLTQLQQQQVDESESPSSLVSAGETVQTAGVDELHLDQSVLEEIARALRGTEAEEAARLPDGATEGSSEHQLFNALQKAFQEADRHNNKQDASSDSTPTGQSPEPQPQAQGSVALSVLLQRREQAGRTVSGKTYCQKNGEARGESYSPEIGEEESGTRMGEFDNASKHAERERIREENRERKKRWREVNQDRSE